MTLEVRRVGAEAAPRVHAIVQAAFATRPPLDPPAAALGETVESLAAALGAGGGLLAVLDGQDVGALVLDRVGSALFLRRFGVLPVARGGGVARALIDAAVEVALTGSAQDAGCDHLAVVAREELPENHRFWARQGFTETRRESPNIELRRPLGTVVVEVADPEAMRALGEALAGLLVGGDVVVLSGELGAGKTTLTQGIGSGLGVRGQVTSPTFVIAREHPAPTGGPGLVHVDAYRLDGVAELEDLDLTASLAESVTVVEWGQGLAEVLADDRLEVRILRALADDAGDAAAAGAEPDPGAEPRRVVITPVGERWRGVALPGRTPDGD